MISLLKADFLRVIKDKLFLILLIICAIMGVISPLFTGLLTILIDSSANKREMYSAAALALSSFSPLNNFGLILSIFMCIILCKDFSNGTMRNKIICGKSRLEIFVTNIIVTIAYTLFFCIIYFLINLGVSLIFFDMQLSTSELVGRFFASIGFELLGWIALSIVLVFFATIFQNTGLSCVLYLALGLLCTIAGGIFTGVRLAYEFYEESPSLIHTLKFFEYVNIPYAMSSAISLGGTDPSSLAAMFNTAANYNLEFCLEYCLSCVVISGIFFALGYLVFRRKNLK